MEKIEKMLDKKVNRGYNSTCTIKQGIELSPVGCRLHGSIFQLISHLCVIFVVLLMRTELSVRIIFTLFLEVL